MSLAPVLGPVLTAFGLLFVVLGIKVGRDRRAFEARSHVAEAQVIDLLYQVGGTADLSRGNGIFKPVVRFVLPDGRQVEVETTHGSSPAPAQPGQWVEVRYDPEQPTVVRLATGLSSGGLLAPLFVVVGSVVALGGLATMVLGLLAARYL
ncbi:DUF3592 domain-containing protein [Nocardioides sp.]|uniref:DUF3592 domain-containing protein n=1 Tax=Nocardioides sp. TaxID=35761 RepID=UPI000C931994|nr:hypothetical protein [Pimelobacter sp.]